VTGQGTGKNHHERKKMTHLKTAREFGFSVGRMQPGPLNLITDVSGVRIGHATIRSKEIQTGVTAVLPHAGNLFREKVAAASHVINGFGKPLGLIQIQEMGTIETPIILTNTLSVGTVADALIRYMLDLNPDIGISTGSVNPIICECNDGYLNDIRGMHVTGDHVRQAIDNAGTVFDQGSVGAGTGMCAYGLKGGIGSASRKVPLDSEIYTLGALVLANMGKKRDLTVCGRQMGLMLEDRPAPQMESVPDGSIIIILATDLPLCERQLGRLARRAQTGVARTGSTIDSGSGEVVVAFSTATRIRHYESRAVVPMPRLHEDRLNSVFQAVAECTEEAILNALIMSAAITGLNGRTVYSLSDFL
jgi:D-aminopeptidase